MLQEPPDLYCGKAYKGVCKKHQSFSKTYKQSLTAVIGHLEDPEGVIKPPQLILLSSCDEYQFWKLHGVVIPGLKQKQWPRLWFGVSLAQPQILIPLELAQHKEGYDDNQLEHYAHERLKEYLQKRSAA